MSDDELYFQEDTVISIREIFLKHPLDHAALHLAYAGLTQLTTQIYLQNLFGNRIKNST